MMQRRTKAEALREWRKANPEKTAKSARKYYEAHSQELAERTRKYREANPDKVVERSRKYREANPAKVAAAMRKWKESNREKIAEYNRKYNEANPPDIKAAVERYRKWREANPEKSRELWQRRRARERGTSGTITAEQIKALLHAQRGECAACGIQVSKGYELDHVMPLVLGGLNIIENAQILCKSCNCKKGKLTPDQWAAKVKRLFPDAVANREVKVPRR